MFVLLLLLLDSWRMSERFLHGWEVGASNKISVCLYKKARYNKEIRMILDNEVSVLEWRNYINKYIETSHYLLCVIFPLFFHFLSHAALMMIIHVFILKIYVSYKHIILPWYIPVKTYPLFTLFNMTLHTLLLF